LSAFYLSSSLFWWRVRHHTGSRVCRQPHRRLLSVYWPARQRKQYLSCNVFSTQHNTIEEWPISGAMFYDVTDRIRFRLCVQLYKCLIDLCRSAALREPQSSAICRPWSAAGSEDQNIHTRRAFGHVSPSTWNTFPNYLRSSAHFLSSLLLDAVSSILFFYKRAKHAWGYLQLTRCIFFLLSLTYLLITFQSHVRL